MLAEARHGDSRDSTNDADTLQHPDQNNNKDYYIEQAFYCVGHRNVGVDQPHHQSGDHENDNNICQGHNSVILVQLNQAHHVTQARLVT